MLLDILNQCHTMGCNSSGSSSRVGRTRNMKSMRPPLAAIFFMTYFYRARGAMPPCLPQTHYSTVQVACNMEIALAELVQKEIRKWLCRQDISESKVAGVLEMCTLFLVSVFHWNYQNLRLNERDRIEWGRMTGNPCRSNFFYFQANFGP